jgi:hypothetical protein
VRKPSFCSIPSLLRQTLGCIELVIYGFIPCMHVRFHGRIASTRLQIQCSLLRVSGHNGCASESD